MLMRTEYVRVTQLNDTCFPFTEQQGHSESLAAYQTAPYLAYSARLRLSVKDDCSMPYTGMHSVAFVRW